MEEAKVKIRTVALTVSLVLAVLWAPLGAAQERGYGWGWGHPMSGMWGAWGIGMMLMMFLFWGLVIVGLVFGVRWLIAQGQASRGDSALAILRERYARGEVSKEEFDAKKRDLA